jgi:hypothetical protein
MDTTETARLCKDVEYAAAQVRTLVRDRADISETLERFWLLQDSLNRLLYVVDQEQGGVGQCRKVIRTVVTTLESPLARSISIPGVRKTCDEINTLLMRLERTTQRARAAGA